MEVTQLAPSLRECQDGPLGFEIEGARVVAIEPEACGLDLI